MLTEKKRAVIRARNDEIERREREAKKKIVRMEDRDEMLAAAESIPVPEGQAPHHQEPPEGGGQKSDRDGSSRGEQQRWRRWRRDPLTAWVCGCYNADDYAGHVSDLRQFFRGIDFQHVSSVGQAERKRASKAVSQFSRCMVRFNPEEKIARRGRVAELGGGGGGQT